ncbi:hypothetical protein [Rhodopirellula sp. MGV]|nr:hypothetical protein [Rhodopirellula sp. MGV]
MPNGSLPKSGPDAVDVPGKESNTLGPASGAATGAGAADALLGTFN